MLGGKSTPEAGERRQLSKRLGREKLFFPPPFLRPLIASPVLQAKVNINLDSATFAYRLFRGNHAYDTVFGYQTLNLTKKRTANISPIWISRKFSNVFRRDHPWMPPTMKLAHMNYGSASVEGCQSYRWIELYTKCKRERSVLSRF